MKKFVVTLCAVGAVSAVYIISNQKDVDSGPQDAQPVGPSSKIPSPHQTSRQITSSSATSEQERDFDFLTSTSQRKQIQLARLDEIDPTSLTAIEIENLISLLAHEPPAHREASWNVIANKLMNLLQHPAIDQERATDALLEMARSEATTPILRDYALQHLGAKLKNSHGLHENQIAEVKDAFIDLITDDNLSQTSIPGTALSVLAHYQRVQPGQEIGKDHLANDPRLNAWMEKSLSPSLNLSPSLRASSIYAIGSLGRSDFGSQVRAIALNPSTDPSVRLTAIAALGSIGSREDLPFLKEISNSEARYRYAAQASLAALQK